MISDRCVVALPRDVVRVARATRAATAATAESGRGHYGEAWDMGRSERGRGHSGHRILAYGYACKGAWVIEPWHGRAAVRVAGESGSWGQVRAGKFFCSHTFSRWCVEIWHVGELHRHRVGRIRYRPACLCSEAQTETDGARSTPDTETECGGLRIHNE